MEENDGGQGSYAEGAQFTGGYDDHGCGSLIHDAGREFFLMVPLVEPHPRLVRTRIMDMRGFYSGLDGIGVEIGRKPDDLARIGMAFEIIKGFDGKEYSVYRQDQRVKKEPMYPPFIHQSAKLTII
jgi:hypothetical protein